MGEGEELQYQALQICISFSRNLYGWLASNQLYRRSLENLMRQVLLMPNRPAILYFHVWMPGFHWDHFQGTTIEDETEVLVQFYGLQSVSLRDAIYIPHSAGVLGFRSTELACSPVHPTHLGHRYATNSFCQRSCDENTLHWLLIANEQYLLHSAFGEWCLSSTTWLVLFLSSETSLPPWVGWSIKFA